MRILVDLQRPGRGFSGAFIHVFGLNAKVQELSENIISKILRLLWVKHPSVISIFMLPRRAYVFC